MDLSPVPSNGSQELLLHNENIIRGVRSIKVASDTDVTNAAKHSEVVIHRVK